MNKLAQKNKLIDKHVVLKNCFVPLNQVLESLWVSEWLLFSASSAHLAIPWREQINFQWYDDEVRLVLDQDA